MEDVVILLQYFECYLGRECKNSLKCFHLNAQSARNKSCEIEMFFEGISVKFDAIFLTETLYTCNADLFKLPMYECYFMNRTTRLL